MGDLDSVLQHLTTCFTQRPRVSSPRACTVDLAAAPDGVRAFVEALRHHRWDQRLGCYRWRGEDEQPVESLRLTLETLEDALDHELEEALAEAGADGGPFDPDQSIELCSDDGGMTVLGLSWSGGTVSLVVLELEEDPNSDGLLMHLAGPGAVVAYLRDRLVDDELGGESIEALARAVVAAGDSIEPAEPIRSRAPQGPATRAAPAAAAAAPSVDVYGVSNELDAAIERDDDAGVEAALAQLDAAWADWRALAMSLRAIFVARDRHPARAVQIADFVLGRPDPSPEEAPELHDEWLGGLLNATAACTRLADGGSEACARVVARAIEQGPVQPALFHNLACYMALRGDRARALELVEAAARHGYEDLAELLADDELAALRDGGALEAAIARGQAAADEAP